LAEYLVAVEMDNFLELQHLIVGLVVVVQVHQVAGFKVVVVLLVVM
jgi:hypothetical protein